MLAMASLRVSFIYYAIPGPRPILENRLVQEYDRSQEGEPDPQILVFSARQMLIPAARVDEQVSAEERLTRQSDPAEHQVGKHRPRQSEVRMTHPSMGAIVAKPETSANGGDRPSMHMQGSS
jgi:hypothetical protein